MLRIATWNVNSIKQRLDHLASFVKSAEPDILCLQELKCIDDAFPRGDIEGLGYNVVTHGQKTYNGVAILSKRPLEDIRRGLPGNDGDEHIANRAHWTGSAWVNHEIADMGGYIPTSTVGANPIERFYSGGVALDHSDPDIAYVSQEVGAGRWDIYRYRTTNNGATWTGSALTSSGKNLRPVSVIDHAPELQVVWMLGTYSDYVDYSVGISGAGT